MYANKIFRKFASVHSQFTAAVIITMQFRTEVSITKRDFNLEVGDGLLLLGSCFTESIGKKLCDLKFDCCVNPFGVLYNPACICRAIEILMLGERFKAEDYLFQCNGLWNNWLFSSEYSDISHEKCLHKIRQSLSYGHTILRNAHTLIITLGTNRAYTYTCNAQTITVANCHKMPQKLFGVRDLNVGSIVGSYKHVMDCLFDFAPKIRVLFTVSPYRYSKYGFHSSNLSKAVLLLAIEALTNEFPDKCFYFPSFEIVVDELRDYRFYADDMLHPSAAAVDYIFEKFEEYAFAEQTMLFAKEWQKILNALNHRPLHPYTKEYRDFLEKTRSKVIELSKKYKTLAFEKEISELDKCLQQLNDEKFLA